MSILSKSYIFIEANEQQLSLFWYGVYFHYVPKDCNKATRNLVKFAFDLNILETWDSLFFAWLSSLVALNLIDAACLSL